VRPNVTTRQGNGSDSIMWTFEIFVFNQVCQRKQVSLAVRRAEEMTHSWETFVINLIEADLFERPSFKHGNELYMKRIC